MRRLLAYLQWVWWALFPQRPPESPDPSTLKRPGVDEQFGVWPPVRRGSLNPQKAADQGGES